MDLDRRLVLVGLGSLAAPSVQAAEPIFLLDVISLYAPAALYEARIGPDRDAMAQFVHGVEGTASKWSAAHADLPALTGVLVIVVKPGGRSRAWVVTREAEMSVELKASLKEQVELVRPVVPVTGPLVFGFAFKLRGGGAEPEGYPSPIPDEWWPIMLRHVSGVSDAVLRDAWPDE